MITCGADGPPQVCVPDWGELRAVDDRHLRVAVWPTDPTAVNLDGGAPVLLIVTALSDVYLVRATPGGWSTPPWCGPTTNSRSPRRGSPTAARPRA